MFSGENPWQSFAALFIGILFIYRLRQFFAGGVCTSRARMSGKTVVVTGCNTGIGRETVLDMCRRGARVAMLCRNLEKARGAADYVKREVQGADVVIYKCDLSSLKSVRECAKEINSQERRIDVLINNAGVMVCPFTRTEDGFEMQIGTNHFGHFLLTNLLLDKIKQSAPSRIVNVSSSGHKVGSMNLDDINYHQATYWRIGAYGQSKLANILFTRELAKRLEGTGVTTYTLHPGVVDTELVRYIDSIVGPLKYVYYPLKRFLHKSPTEGAQTSIQCAVADELANATGKYYSDCVEQEPSSKAKDDVSARRLWDLSARAVKLQE